jgi:hypothetical protein
MIWKRPVLKTPSHAAGESFKIRSFYTHLLSPFMTHAKSISIAHTQGAKVLSPGQKKFNTLVKKIDVQRKLLVGWNDAAPLCQQWHATEMLPLLLAHRELLVELVRLLDRRVDDKGFSKADRQALREMVCDLAPNLFHGKYEEEMKAVYNRNSDTDLDTEEAQDTASLKAMMERELGVDLGDMVDLNTPEALMQRLHQEMQTRDDDAARAAQAREQHRSERKPSAKQARAQAQAQAEAENTSQSIREVYRKLASALHPDREPDATERQRKTGLMQRVNQAYANKDLLSLLQLQLEIEQIDQSAIDGIAEDRLKHFNKVLSEQLSELQDEVGQLEMGFIHRYDLDPFVRITPTTMHKALVRQKQGLQHDIQQMRWELKTLVDVSSIKRWLKVQRANARQSMMQELMGDFDLPF